MKKLLGCIILLAGLLLTLFLMIQNTELNSLREKVEGVEHEFTVNDHLFNNTSTPDLPPGTFYINNERIITLEDILTKINDLDDRQTDFASKFKYQWVNTDTKTVTGHWEKY